MTLNERIERYCEEHGLKFKPWEYPPPWDVEDNEPCPYPEGTGAHEWWPKVLKMRAKIIAELVES